MNGAAPKVKEEPSFLKKRSKRLLSPRTSHLGSQEPYLAAGAGNKSLLVLFFRKEHLFSMP
jgi:hypothetical protein